MDPLSQAVTGAAFAGLFSNAKTLRPALLIGALAGMAPDLDVLIHSGSDPLLTIEYHRHFTHSIPFAPIGGLICALFFWLFPFVHRHLTFTQCALYSILGVFTHGLLDACTGYGTHLLWPLSNVRESWNFIGIIDLPYTLPAFFLLVLAAKRLYRKYAFYAMVAMTGYLVLGAWQQYRASDIAHTWLEAHKIEHEALVVRPTLGNLWLWRMIYKDTKQDHWQVHALHLPYWSGDVSIKEGETAAIYSADMNPEFSAETTAGNDIRRFAFFSDNYLARYEQEDGSTLIGDVRYSMYPQSTAPLWAIELPTEPEQHIIFHRSLRERINWKEILSLLKGEGFTSITHLYAK